MRSRGRGRNGDADEAETTLTKDAAAMNPVDSWDGATILADPEDELIGKTLNDTYLVERVLGEGGMGRVYLARHNRIAQKRVAVKVLHPEYLRNVEMLARFQREAETAASICHPNVVVVYDVDRTPRGLPYLVCEYLEGRDLGNYLKEQKTLPLPMAVHVLRQLCEGLQSAHQSGVIHRDLKPHNIFLVGDFAEGVPELPFIKILDFGLSKFIDVTEGQLVTKTGVVMGTPAFMAPEQALGQRADIRADIYGAGALLYTCLTGQVPFEESTPQATVLAVINGEPTRPRVLAPSISEYAELVIQRAMAKQASERYPDMAAMLKALEPLYLEQPSGENSGTRPVRLASFDAQTERATSARPKLFFLLVVAFGFLLGSTAVALVGIEQLAGWSLTRRELGLLLGCTAAVAFTPTLLVMRRIRNAVWTNTNRVLGLFYAVRVALLTALVTYGLAWFGSRLFDGVVFRLMDEPIRSNLTWPGWDFLLPVMALGAGAVALLRERLMSEMLRGWKRATVLGVMLVTTLTLALIGIPLGLRWQTRQATSPTATSTVEPSNPQPLSVPVATPQEVSGGSLAGKPDTKSAEPGAIPPLTSDPAVPSAGTPVGSAQNASDEELNVAAASGVSGWLPLAERYPNDPRVLRALVMSHASRAAELGDAMVVARRLFKVAPEEIKRGDLQFLVQRATETPGAPAEFAWKMLVEDMGSVGPDMLYNLMLNKPKLADRAERLLGDASVRKRASAALIIAYDLRVAQTCAARLPMLERAVEFGDERASAVLGALTTGSAHGCGKNKRKPCLPACPEQLEPFRAAMAKLTARLKSADR